MEISELVTKLKEMSTRTHRGFDRSIGKRGGTTHSSDFAMGSYAVIDNIIQAIENDDVKTLDNWYEEQRK